MTSVQERVTRAMSATAAKVAPGSVPSLDLPAGTAARFQPRGADLVRRAHNAAPLLRRAHRYQAPLARAPAQRDRARHQNRTGAREDHSAEAVHHVQLGERRSG